MVRLPRRVATRALILWRIVALTIASTRPERRIGCRWTCHESKR
jgi:hypothetical protein